MTGLAQPMRIPASAHKIQQEQICERADAIIRKLQKAGYEAYLVGGCVRDLLLGLIPKDFDIATSAHPEQVRKIFSSARLIGRRFRLAHIYYGRDYIEVATFRAPHDESAQGQVNEQGRILHDNVYGSLEEDVWRRDFTINALFYDPVSGDVIDYVDGMQDLVKRRLHLIGDAEQRYREDPVRMLRALRFAAKLDFELDGPTGELIYSMGHLLHGVAPARLFDELLKLLHSGHGWKTFLLLEQYQLLPALLPVTATSLAQDAQGVYRKLLQSALTNTDNRIAEGKSVMPAFLFAVLLWERVHALTVQAQLKGHPELQALHIAATDVLRDQVKITAIPRRFSNVTREIWGLQSRFRHRDLRRANILFNNPRFRASYDFLCLRASAGEQIVADDCEWWTQFQETTAEDRPNLCKNGGKKRRTKRKKAKPTAE
ncbi:MAG: polynucleotide adenylyltransferase PcnB [Thiolinea sp.]